MDNPYEVILIEIKNLQTDVNILLQRISEERPIKYYSPQDIADNTPVGIQTVRSKIKKGIIEAKQIGRKYLISQQEFERICKDAKSLKYKRTA